MRSTVTLVLGLLALTVLAYAGVVWAGFVYEDRHWLDVLTGSLRPTPNLARWSLEANTAVGGSDPFGFHVVNVGVHLLNGLLVAGLLWMWTARPLVPVLASAIFLLHPIQVEAVAYVSGRPDLVSTTLVLVTLLLVKPILTTASDTARVGGLLACGAMAWLAVVTRMSAIAVLPLIGLLIWQARRWHWGIGLAGGLATAMFLVLWRGPLGDAMANASAGTVLGYAAQQATAVWNLATLVVLPVGLSVDHDYALVPMAINAVALVALLAGFGAALWSRSPIAFGLAWAAIAVLPRFLAVGVYGPHMPELINEHQFYLSFVGVSLAMGAGLSQWMERDHAVPEDALQGRGVSRWRDLHRRRGRREEAGVLAG